MIQALECAVADVQVVTLAMVETANLGKLVMIDRAFRESKIKNSFKHFYPLQHS